MVHSLLALGAPLAAALAAGIALTAPAAAAEPETCLSQEEIREEVAARRVVPQLAALRAARAKLGGEPVRARLCRGDGGLVYTITALRRDGRVIRVVVDAASGKVRD